MRASLRTTLGRLWAKRPGANGRSKLLQLDEDDVSRRIADVLSVMLLSRKPPDSSHLQLHLSPGVPRREAPAKRRQRVHDAVGMLVRCRVVARVVGELKHPNSFVFEDHLVVIRVADRRIEAAHAMRVAGVRPRRTNFARKHALRGNSGCCVRLAIPARSGGCGICHGSMGTVGHHWTPPRVRRGCRAVGSA
jgi:hypothetical protein